MVKESAYIIGLGWLAGIIVALIWTVPHPLIWVEGLAPALLIIPFGIFVLVANRQSPTRFARARRTIISAGVILFTIQYAGHVALA